MERRGGVTKRVQRAVEGREVGDEDQNAANGHPSLQRVLRAEPHHPRRAYGGDESHEELEPHVRGNRSLVCGQGLGCSGLKARVLQLLPGKGLDCRNGG